MEGGGVDENEQMGAGLFLCFLRLSAGFPLCCAPFEPVVIKEACARGKRNKRVLI